MGRRTRTDAAVRDISKARIVQRLQGLHRPHEIYEACHHWHALNDPEAFEIEGVGMTCADGLVAVVCAHCCMDDGHLREVCPTEHKHLHGYSVCPTMAIVEGRDAPWIP